MTRWILIWIIIVITDGYYAGGPAATSGTAIFNDEAACEAAAIPLRDTRPPSAGNVDHVWAITAQAFCVPESSDDLPSR